MRGSTEFARGVQLLEGRQPKQALECFDAAETHGYDPDQCAGGRWHASMLQGNFEQAWRESDDIAARGGPDPDRLWDGTSFNGRRVIIRCLHGYGDAIQFLRYAPLLRKQARRVVVETHPEMVGVLSCLHGVDQVITWGDGSSPKFTDWDQQIEVMELPRVFRTTLERIPRQVPYLFPTKAAIARSAAILGNSQDLRVGLLWGSGEWNPARSAPFAEFARIAREQGMRFYSFQRGPQRRDLTARDANRLFDTANHSATILDTAADLVNMDLFITVDTMAAHLAGALARPVWVLLPWDADWRWMLDREDSPWYPTMKLFRQPVPGDWASVINRVIQELRQWREQRERAA